MQAVELAIQQEKNRNEQLMKQIQQLQEQVKLAESKPATPTPPPPEPAEKSALETLVQQALNRMNDLEQTFKDSQTQMVESNVAGKSKGTNGVEKKNGSAAGSKQGKGQARDSDDEPSNGSDDDDGEDSDDETITTPTGHTVS